MNVRKLDIAEATDPLAVYAQRIERGPSWSQSTAGRLPWSWDSRTLT